MYRRRNPSMKRNLHILFYMLLLGMLPAPAFAQQPGAAGLGDQLYPQLGNGGYDVQHYSIDLHFTPETEQLRANTTIDAVATQALSSFNLDLVGFQVESVIVNGAPAAFERVDAELIIAPAQPLSQDAAFSVTVVYEGKPQAIDDPAVGFIALGWQKWADGYFAAASEPSGSMTWFPCNNHPLDKATYTMRVRAPRPFMALANGTLRETIAHKDDTRSFVWRMAQPMASYLATVIIGEFVEARDDSGSVPIRNFFPAGYADADIAGYAVTSDMLVWLEALLGPYPFDAYGVAVLPGFPTALETQSLSIISAATPPEVLPAVILHELLHQWFGNSVTLSQWRDIWLHEGFATYFMALWQEEQYGAAAYERMIRNSFARFSERTAPGNPAISQLFGDSVYFRGALVLHALRRAVGDQTFFDILRSFYRENAYGNVTTADFIAVAERLAGRDLDALFADWLYGERSPSLP